MEKLRREVVAARVQRDDFARRAVMMLMGNRLTLTSHAVLELVALAAERLGEVCLANAARRLGTCLDDGELREYAGGLQRVELVQRDGRVERALRVQERDVRPRRAR